MIQLFHVEMAYSPDAVALRDISLTVPRGEFVFLTGPSGAGKTTLLKLVARMLRCTAGQILVGGRNVARMRESSIPYLRRNIGVVFQDFKLLTDRSAFENVAFALEVVGTQRAEIRKRVMSVLRRVGLDQRANLPVPKLSGGEQQRVAIARALVNDPAIVLADEPTGNLDPELTVEILELFQEAHERGTTVLFATHDREMVARTGHRVIALEGGRIVADSRPREAPALAAG